MLSVLKDLSSLAEKRKIKIIFGYTDRYCVMACSLLYEVFFNIISNAVKYSPEKSSVVIDIIEKKDTYLVKVSDQGEGIPDKYKKVIFERFKKLEKGVIKGTGLGLAITKKIVELHKGRVWVEDNKRKGSIFFVELDKI